MRFTNVFVSCATIAGVTAFCFVGSGASRTSNASAASAAILSPVPDPADGFGTIKGRLVLGEGKVPEFFPPDTSKANDEFCKGKKLKDPSLTVDPATKGVANTFAYLVNVKGKNPEAEKELLEKNPKVEIDNKNCEFVPYATAVMKGQTIVFHSSDPTSHNTHWSGFENNGNVTLPPNGKIEQPIKPEKNLIKLQCDIHNWMKGEIMAFDHPFFAITGKDGSFEIKGVPAGAQNLLLRNNLAGFVTPNGSRGISVTVKAGETTDVGEIKLDPAKIKK